MSDNSLQPRKLGIFKRIRKAIVIRRMSSQRALNFSTLPEYLQYDDEVIESVIEANGDMIGFIPQTKLGSAIKEHPELITRIWDLKKQNALINQDPSLILQFDENKHKNLILNFIFNSKLEGQREFIKLLSVDLQKTLITDTQQYSDYLEDEFSATHDARIRFSRHTDTAIYIDQFSEEAILAIAKDDEKKSEECKKSGMRHEKTLLKRNYSSKLIYDLTKLPIQT